MPIRHLFFQSPTNPYAAKAAIKGASAKRVSHGTAVTEMRSVVVKDRKKGSMTVEAAMVVPLFLFTVLNMFSAINYIAAHMRMQAAMHQTGLVLARTGYAYHKLAEGYDILESEIANIGFSHLYAREKVVAHAGEAFLDRIGISGNAEGILFLQSDIVNPECLDLVATYYTKALFLPESFAGFGMVNRAYMKVWTGYDNAAAGAGEQEGEVVYITSQGEVYHTERSCTHLQLSVSQIPYADVAQYQNEDGVYYTRCERCGKQEMSVTVYITQEGDRYHASLSCGGLRRTVMAVYLEDVEGRRACSRCSGR